MLKTVSAVVIALSMPSSMAFAEDLPSSGSFEATFFGVDMPDKASSLPTASDKSAWVWNGTYSYVNMAGTGFFHDTTGRCIAMGSGDNTESRTEGFCSYADQDGDQIHSTFTFIMGALDQPGHGTKKFTGGTGKYAGLTGTAEYTGTVMKPLDEKMPEVFKGHVTGTYSINAEVGSK